MQRIFDYLRARLFDLRKKRAIKQARRDAATYGKKFIVVVWDKHPVCVSMQAVKTLIRQRRLVGVTPEKIQQQAIFVAFPPSKNSRPCS
ncbi:MAG: hypothetical protein UH625_10895 [Muribaculaceae bacterium]|nr:hypothetical protein [Muribaculaceae bacterium]